MSSLRQVSSPWTRIDTPIDEGGSTPGRQWTGAQLMPHRPGDILPVQINLSEASKISEQDHGALADVGDVLYVRSIFQRERCPLTSPPWCADGHRPPAHLAPPDMGLPGVHLA